MVNIEYIRKKHFVEDWSIRKISKELGISRQTVRKALASTEIPKYNLTKPRPCPVLDKFRGIIDTWLAEDERAPKKQRHTARRIYDRLVAEYGFTGGESTVRHYVAQVRRKAQEAFIPLEAAWGEQAQVDWGQAQVKIAGVQITVHLFFLRMRSSRVPFVRAYPTEKMEAFMAGIEFLKEHGGPGDVVLSRVTQGNLMPYLIGLKPYLGHILETLHYKEKLAKTKKFFAGEMSESEAQRFLKKAGIRWIVVDNMINWTKDRDMDLSGIKELPYKSVSRVFANNRIIIWERKEVGNSLQRENFFYKTVR